MREPKHTCPLIDSVISDLESMQSDVTYILNKNGIDIEEAKSLIDNLVWAISNILGNNGKMENIRDANTEIRAWGSYWKTIADENEHECLEIQSKYDALVDEFDELKDDLGHVQKQLNEYQNENNN